MKTSESLAGKPRSSPRTKSKRVGESGAIEAPDSNTNDEERHMATVENGSLTDAEEKRETPTKPRRRVKTKAGGAKEEQTSPEKKTGSMNEKQRKRVKLEDEEAIEEQSLTVPTQASSQKRKILEQTEGASEINGETPRKPKRKRVSKVEEVAVEGEEASPTKVKRKKTDIEEEDAIDGEASPKKTKRKTKIKEEKELLDENGEPVKKIRRKRKTQEEKDAEAMPLATRTNGIRMFVGAHVSCAKGVHNTVTNCVHIGGNAFAMFLKSQRKWENPPLQDEHRDLFISHCGDHKYDASNHVLPHGSYLVNLAQEDAERAAQGYTAFLDDLHRCESLGIKLYNFHPGWTGSHPRPSAIARIAQALNRAHLATKTVTPVLETMAGGGNVIGSTFEDLRDIIALIDDKKRIGVCLDTCHVFAAGYDLRSPTAFKKTLDDFDNIVGLSYLRALHINDSKAPFASHRDLHQNIGLGFLGLRAFYNIMNEPRFEGLPLVLETPIDRKDPETGKDVEDKGVWAREIKMLEGLIGMDAEGEEFMVLEKELAEEGAEERAKLQEQFDRKVEKERQKGERGQMKLDFGKGARKKRKGSEKGIESEA